MKEVYDVELRGCAPVPLAHYLKALGILRVVVDDCEDGDPGAKGYWQGDVFHIISQFEKESLLRYFLHCYKPTPIIAPWNGRGGFLEGEEDSSRAGARMIQIFGSSHAPRFSKYKDAIEIINSNEIVTKLNKLRSNRKKLEAEKERLNRKKKNGLNDDEAHKLEDFTEKLRIMKKQEDLIKKSLLHSLRSTIPDSALSWMDACIVLTGGLEDKAPTPPLLGSGGVDGSQDFSVNFMQHLNSVISIEDGGPIKYAEDWLNNALFGDTVDGLRNATVGQFYPSAVGGANATTGYEANSLINPWDYIFMIEGALLFAAASVRRLGTDNTSKWSAPFTVASAGVGYGSASDADEKSIRSAEIWVPLWDRPTGLYELKVLMGEGRSQVGKRSAKNGVDFARAVASLGVDRGITSFQRYGFLERNGRNYFAVPLDRFMVNRQPQVELLSEVDDWMIQFGDKAKSERAPASIGRAFRKLETAVFSLCKGEGPARVQDVLIALGGCEKAIGKSFRWAKKSFARPVPMLSEHWLREADDGTPEFRLAASLASVYGHYADREGKEFVMPLRSQMESVHAWSKDGNHKVDLDDVVSCDVVWSDGDPISVMNDIMSRRIMRAVQSGSKSYPDRGRIVADQGDIADFIEDRVDLYRIMDLLWGLILVNWPTVTKSAITRRSLLDTVQPGASYGLLKLCFSGEDVQGSEVPLMPEIHRQAALGDSLSAMQLAERRLRGCNFSPALGAVKLSSRLMARIAAALLFPIGRLQVTSLAETVLRPEKGKAKNSWMGEEETVRSE